MNKQINIEDYRCDICRMPSLPGVCGPCRIMVKPDGESPDRPWQIIAWIVAIGIAVLVAGLATVAGR